MKHKTLVGIDARTIFLPNPRGTGQCLIRLFNHLAPLEPSWDFYFYCYPGNNGISFPFPNIMRMPIDIKGSRFNLWEQLRLPIAAFSDKVDLLHCPAQTSPYFTACPKVVTIHDLIPLKIKGEYPNHLVKIFKRNLIRSLKTAKKIITVSEYSKQDIIRTFPFVKAEDITIISWPALHDFSTVNKLQNLGEVKVRYGLNKPYIFAYGAGEPRKNTTGLIKSFALFVHRNNYDAQLLIGGLRQREKTTFATLAKELNMRENIVFAEYIPDDDMPYVMNGAEFFTFITLYEGFGLPLTDAMACKVPILTSNVTSIPEVVGDAGLLVDPYNHEEVASAMETLFKDNSLRKSLIEKGRSRSKLFSWDNTARKVISTYKEVLQK